ncbi:MAG TPA: A/G-specific adenine glycosylase [Salinivirga sp.]|uniref:A/G-specific adenine glycosylase n=1 Tax=Salinivirga sp. TaxID=1970192 RepID=UPI002B467854|nr:A/G-specific adenine glycosylase [Salinivirga sp.]HKK58300.1 A/G-specific adenine glycosylase [Salinivirga sp.]
MENITRLLLIWYKQNKRTLPWRLTDDPYKIWLSEIILQQTRVDQGISYYHKLIDQYPQIYDLASASQDDILKLWQGLGYYTRARNLHKAAKLIVDERKGQFPDNYKDLLKIPGIGPYTAAAIASIAFNECIPAIDGNVKRVVSRLLAIHEPVDHPRTIKTINEIANDLIDPNEPGEFNQAMMELGAKICLPGKPKCSECPVSGRCEALRKNIQTEVPLKKRKVKKRTRRFYYFVLIKDNFTNLQQRGPNDIWEGLYEFPMIEHSEDISSNEILALADKKFGVNVNMVKEMHINPVEKHILTHQTIFATFIRLVLSEQPDKLSLNINKSTLQEYPVSRLTEIYLNKEKKLL